MGGWISRQVKSKDGSAVEATLRVLIDTSPKPQRKVPKKTVPKKSAAKKTSSAKATKSAAGSKTKSRSKKKPAAKKNDRSSYHTRFPRATRAFTRMVARCDCRRV